MSYTSITFICFLLVTGIAYFLVPKRIQWGVLLAASLGFYVLSCGARVLLLVAACGILYGAGLLIGRLADGFAEKKKGLDKESRKALKKAVTRQKKYVVFGAVLLTLLMLLGTKYFNFFGSIGNGITGLLGMGAPIPVLKILMPLGISYYTLMGISYVVDVYRGTANPEKNPLMLLLYLCYFPHIIEGPFDRYTRLTTQFRTPHPFDYDRMTNGGIRLIWGLFKKFVIADRAGLIVNTIFADTASYGGSVQLAAVLLYTFQIYAEFSGCMDMVCGISQMFGVDMAENFKRPFFAVSINDFWRRWHITLGEWLKDYIFYPVSLSGHFQKINERLRRHIKSEHLTTLLPSAYALFFVWFANGMWHGASVKYIVYGLYYYALMMLGQALRPLSAKAMARLHIMRESRGYHLFEVLRTGLIVCFGMLIFRADTLQQAGSMFASIFTKFGAFQLFNGTLLVSGIGVSDYVILALAFCLVLTISLLQERGVQIRQRLAAQMLPVRWMVYFGLLFAFIIFGAYGGNFTNTAFIYGEF